MNNFTATGRLGRDAEVRYTQQGTAIASFPLAVDVGFGDNKRTLWLRCNIWGKRAEGGLIQYLIKGAQVAVSGEISTSEWDKQDGGKGFSVELRVNDLDLLGGKPSGQGAGQGNVHKNANQASMEAQMPGISDDELNDEIPF